MSSFTSSVFLEEGYDLVTNNLTLVFEPDLITSNLPSTFYSYFLEMANSTGLPVATEEEEVDISTLTPEQLL
jgi:hypothetical protein